MANLTKTSSASHLNGFAGLFGMLCMSFDPVTAFVLTLLVLVVSLVLTSRD